MIISNKLNITYNAIMPDGKIIAESTESNTVTTEILTYSVLKDIRPDKTTVRIGESVLYTVTITNNSSTKLLNNSFAISHPDGASYVAGSVKINGVAQPNYDPVTGFMLPDLNPDDTVIIEYELKADKPITAPVTHFATLQYTVNDPFRSNDVSYTENTDAVSITTQSNQVQTVIQQPYYNDKTIYYNKFYYCDYCDCCNCDQCCCCCHCRYDCNCYNNQ